jgi:hypothetical protein
MCYHLCHRGDYNRATSNTSSNTSSRDATFAPYATLALLLHQFCRRWCSIGSFALLTWCGPDEEDVKDQDDGNLRLYLVVGLGLGLGINIIRIFSILCVYTCIKTEYN